MKRFDVCVRGSGIVGRSLALALARRGLQVALAGRAEARAGGPDIRAYALNAHSVALMSELRVWDALPADARTRVTDMHIAGDAKGELEFTAWQQCVTELAWIVDAAALEEVLAQAVRYAPNVTTVEAATEAALRAVCEGRDSSTRAAFGAGFTSHGYGQRAIAARLTSELPHAGVAWQWFRSPDVLALLPFDRPQADRSFGLVWSLPDAQAQHWLDAPVNDFEAALNEATGGAAGRLTLASERAAWPLSIGRAQRWCGPGWVLVGDAAHIVHPLAGQGLNLGLADVACLADVLARARADEPWRSAGDERTLRRYVRARLAPTLAMSALTDGLLQLFSQSDLPLRELRNRGLTLVNRLPPLKRWLAGRALNA